MTESHRKESLAYLSSKKLESHKLPVLNWQEGSSVLTVGSKNNAIKIDFADTFSKKIVRLNGYALRLDGSQNLKNLLKEIKAATNKYQNAALGALLPEAFAEDYIDTIGTAFFYWTGADQFYACVAKAEVLFTSQCVVRSDEGFITSVNDTHLKEFTCDGSKFLSMKAKVADHDLEQELKFDYDQDGQIKIIRYSHGVSLCKLDIKDNKIVAVNTPGNCFAAIQGYTGMRDLKVGDSIPRGFFTLSYPVKRLQECCKSEKCKQSVQTHIQSQSKKPTDEASESGATTQQ